MAVKVVVSLILTAGILLAQPGRDRGGQQPRTATAADDPGPGNAGRGLAVFEGKGACLTCHRVTDKGSRLGPDLSDVGIQRTRDALEQSLLDPNPEVQPQNRSYRVVTRDGAVYTGKLLNQDVFSVQVLDSQERLRGFQKSNLREYNFVASSPMPSYRDKLSSEELADLIAYLASLKGVNK
jgi:putative heme-binding domain-containing protein